MEAGQDYLDAARAGDLEWLQSNPWQPLEEWTDQRGVTAYHYAAANDHGAVLDYLLKDIEKRATLHKTDRYHARILNAQNEDGNTPLHWACLNGALSSVRVLLDRKADLLIKNKSGQTPLYYAEMMNKNDVVQLIMDSVAVDEKEIEALMEEEDGAEQMEDGAAQLEENHMEEDVMASGEI